MSLTCSPSSASFPVKATANEPLLEFVLRQRLEPRHFGQQLSALVTECKAHGISEVLLYPHGVLLHDSPTGVWEEEQITSAVNYLSRAKAALEEQGISMGINLWNSIGHGDRGRIGPSEFQFLVSEEGVPSRAQPCPLCPKWRAYFKKCLVAYATVKPSKFFYDDDLRHHNHQSDRGTGRFNCFCPLHVERFNKVTGNSFDRESLLRAVLTTSGPGSIREQWLEELHTIIVELCEEMEVCLHEVSPETEIGLMSSGADQVLLEGRRFSELLPAVAGPGRRLLYRPCFSYYIEPAARDIPEVLALYRSVQPDLPKSARLYAEIDNCMPTEYNSSPVHMVTRMMLAALCGTRAYHLSLLTVYGNADTYESNRDYVALLQPLRESLQPILGDLHGPVIAHGFYLPRNSRQVVAKEVDGAQSMADLLVDTLRWAKPLQLAGFPISFEPGDVAALTENALWGLSEAEVDGLIGKAALLDFTAVQWLVKRGYGPKIGVRSAMTRPVVEGRRVFAEEVVDPCDTHFGMLFDHTPLHSFPLECSFGLGEEASPVTMLKGREDLTIGPGAFQYRGTEGATIMGLPLFPEALEFNPFLCRYRIRSLRGWLERALICRGTPFFYVSNQPNGLPLHVQYGEVHLLAWVNLRSQRARGVELRCFGIPPVRQAFLWEEAVSTPIAFTLLSQTDAFYDLKLEGDVPPFAAVILRTA